MMTDCHRFRALQPAQKAWALRSTERSGWVWHIWPLPTVADLGQTLYSHENEYEYKVKNTITTPKTVQKWIVVQAKNALQNINTHI